jgi:hypothetical protein
MDYCNMDQCGDTLHGLLQYGPVWRHLTWITAIWTNVETPHMDYCNMDQCEDTSHGLLQYGRLFTLVHIAVIHVTCLHTSPYCSNPCEVSPH